MDISPLRLGEALNGHFKQLCRMALTESDLWERMAKFAIEQVDARRSVIVPETPARRRTRK